MIYAFGPDRVEYIVQEITMQTREWELKSLAY